MSSGSILRYLDLRFEQADEPEVPAELRYSFTNSASNIAILYRL
jgi:hypothetical protein